MGYYLPEGAEVPDQEMCEWGILGEIREKCAGDSRWNAGSINVGEMPGFGGDGTAVVGGEARWVMAPERLTL